MASVHRRSQASGDATHTGRIVRFAPAGQSTQMVVGATSSSDTDILATASRLYLRHQLRRVYYSAFSPIPGAHATLPARAPALVREHRLYQADWLMRYYGFAQTELTTAAAPNLDLTMDPKLAWALRHPEFFPIDLNAAPREHLLRVPGLGTTAVSRLLAARRHHRLRIGDLSRLRARANLARQFVVAEDHRPVPAGPGARLVMPEQLPLFTA